MFWASYVLVYRLNHSYRFQDKHSDKKSFSECLIATFVVYISQVTFTVLFLGVVVRNLDFTFIIALNIIISGLILGVCRKQAGKASLHFLDHCRSSVWFVIKSGDVFLYIILLLFSLQMLWLVIKIYYLPPDVWDVFAYHLHPVVEWFQKNMIPGTIDTPVVRLNRNPAGPKLFHFWLVKFTGDLTWVELPQFFYGILLALTSYALMRKVQVAKNAAIKYAVLIYFIPLVLIESRTCQDHLTLMTLLLIATLYLVNVVFEKVERLEKNNSQLVFLGLSLGLLLGTKISGAHILAVFFLAIFLSKGFNWSRVKEFITGNHLQILLGCVALLTLGAYWYVKDKAILGSYLSTIERVPPVKLAAAALGLVVVVLLWVLIYPKLRSISRLHLFKNKPNKKVIIALIIVISVVAIAGIVINVGLIKTFVMGHHTPTHFLSEKSFYDQHPILRALKSDFMKNVLVFPFRIKDIGFYIPYTPDFLEQSGFGPQFFGFGLIAYAVMFGLMFRRKYRDSIPGFMFIFSVLLLGTYFLYYYSIANYRMFMFFPVFGIILWAFLIERWHVHNYVLKYLDVLIIVMILFNVALTSIEGNLETQRWKNMFTLDNRLERTTIKYSTLFQDDDWKFIDKYIPVEEPIGYIGYYDSWISPYFDNQMKRRIVHIRSLDGFHLVDLGNEQSELVLTPLFKESLKQHRIHFIHLNPQGIRHRKGFSPIVIRDPDVYPLTVNLYYFKPQDGDGV